MRWWLVVLAALIGAVMVFPFDEMISKPLRTMPIKGDVKRTLETLQQFGDAGTVVLTAVLIWLLDPGRRVRLLDMFSASVLTAICCYFLKVAAGRPRPERGEEWLLWRGWEWSKRTASDFQSMPSSHTAAATALAVYLTLVYPSLRPLMIGLVVIAGVSRVVLGSHYPSDVLCGAAMGFLVAYPIVSNRLGVRLFAGSKAQKNVV